jgi:hypothetical protein
LFGVKNSRKARLGGLGGLQDPAILRRKLNDEKALIQAVANDPQLKQATGDPWADVIQTLRIWDEIFLKYDLLERGSALQCDPFHIARTLLRMADEDAKPNAERLREFRESNRDSLLQELLSEAPIYDDLETIRLADALAMWAEMAGMHDPLLRRALAGKSPPERAAELIAGSKLKDVAVRKQLAEGGAKALAAAKDPLVELARLVDPAAREVRKTYEEQIEEPQRQAYAKLANARFKLYGTDIYPDATFTLRLALGEVKGYTEQGRAVPAFATIAGAFQRSAEHKNREPFNLPESWLTRKDQLDPATPLNFVLTADIIGGNSGSPVVNRQGEVVGLIFDGNLPSLVWDFVFSDEIGRAIAVDTRAIVHALRKVYGAGALADELGN